MTVAAIEVKALKPGFGAEILGLDVSRASPREVAGVVAEFQRHGAVLLRDQKLTPDQLMKFISAFGEAEDHTLKQFTLEGYPKIYLLSNRTRDGVPIGAHNDGVGWHTDYSYKAEPVMMTMLYAVEVPPEGSDTLLADGCAAWNALTPEQRAQIEPLKLHHSYQHFMRTRQYGAQELPEDLVRDNPDVVHPLVRTHPADGRKALWPSTGTVTEVIGMPGPEGLKLVDELVEFMTQARFVYRHKWRVGDLLMWDNRCTLHTGTLYDDQKYFRTMYRMWVRGDRPY
ncbi:MAG TPA: TauD/TfdA family dioxygenase [Caulobacteraceae bacterium]|nr:TauD/TfdA family dioxygenase [Caulobacteraceae bacterium]